MSIPSQQLRRQVILDLQRREDIRKQPLETLNENFNLAYHLDLPA
jgi:hypothetical protein